MFNLEKWLYAVIVADGTLAALLASTAGSPTIVNMFPAGADIQPEQFPCITFQDAGSTLNSVTKIHSGRLRLNIFSVTNMSEVMTIYTRLAQIINFQHSRTTHTAFNGVLFWIREDLTNDSPDTTRRLWKKMVDFKYWMVNPDLT